MRKIKLLLEYDGTNYHGWQTQPHKRTIQEAIESTVSKITKAKTTVIVSGRTDAGVHALGQVAHFATNSEMTPEEFKNAINSSLPRDIVVKNAYDVDDDFHARFSAISRIYEYTILNDETPSAFLLNYTYWLRKPIVDVNIMNDACKSLIGEHDFTSFAITGDPVNSYVRTVENALCWESRISNSFGIHNTNSEKEIRLIHFRIEANAFLRGMVRAIAGTLLEIGKGKMNPEKMREIIEAKDRSGAGPSLPAKGLCLVRVDY